MTGHFSFNGLQTSFGFDCLIKRTAICATEYERTRFDHSGAPSSALITSKTVKQPINSCEYNAKND